MVYFFNFLCTLPLRIGCQFSRLTVRYLSEGSAYQNFFFANYKAVRDIFLFLCLFKKDHKSTEKMAFLIKVSFYKVCVAIAVSTILVVLASQYYLQRIILSLTMLQGKYCVQANLFITVTPERWVTAIYLYTCFL